MPVTLDDDFSNIPAFVDDLFATGRRDLGPVLDAIRGGALTFSFVDASSRRRILRSWLAAWQQAQGDPFDQGDFNRCPVPDRALLSFFAAYIKNKRMQLVEPRLEFAGMARDSIARYRSLDNKWRKVSFLDDGRWSYGRFDDEGNPVITDSDNAVVARFLSHLFHGAHLVAISAGEDLNGQTDTILAEWFGQSFDPDMIRSDPGNSHYTATVNLGGLYYLSIGSDTLPPSNPLLVAVLFGTTADITTNTFVQNEGWQSRLNLQFNGGPRHNADFQANKATLWNFSTYGATVYSEKRSTTVFLAPDAFRRDIDATTHMPLYVGAGSLQAWMNPDLLQIE